MRLKAANPATRAMSDVLYVITGCGMGYMGSMEAPKQLGDVLEALIGAVYKDSGDDLLATYPVRPSRCMQATHRTARVSDATRHTPRLEVGRLPRRS